MSRTHLVVEVIVDSSNKRCRSFRDFYGSGKCEGGGGKELSFFTKCSLFFPPLGLVCVQRGVALSVNLSNFSNCSPLFPLFLPRFKRLF